MKKILVEWFCFDKEGQTCGRCDESFQVIKQTVEKMLPVLNERDIVVDLKAHLLDESKIDDSNTITINGKNILELLNERDHIFTYCRSCTAITGKPSECRVFIYKNMAYESIPEEMLREAILQEASTLPETG
jgi:hypothetical protein